MRSPQFSEPRLSIVKGNELPLSGPALLDLMRAVLARGVPFRFCARGWSMTPFIRDGDIITVLPLLCIPPGIGNIIAFIRPGTEKLVVHRVVGRNGASVLVRGDSYAAHSDGAIPPENLLGRVARVERDGHPVWLGLGPEGFLVAMLSRTRLLNLLLIWFASLRKRFS